MTKRKTLLLALSFAALAAVATTSVLLQQKDMGTFEFRDIDDVDVVVKITGFEGKAIRGQDYAFLYFEYSVDNQYHPKAVQFDPSAVRLRCNGVINSETHYHSIASAIAEPMSLPPGQSTYFLYSVYPAGIKTTAVDSLALEDAGFSISAFGTTN